MVRPSRAIRPGGPFRDLPLTQSNDQYQENTQISMECYYCSNKCNMSCLFRRAVFLLLLQRDQILPFFLPSFVFLLFSIAFDHALFEERPRIVKKKNIQGKFVTRSNFTKEKKQNLIFIQ